MPLPDRTCVLSQTPVHLHPTLQGLDLQYNEQREEEAFIQDT